MDDVLISRQAVMDCFKKWQPYMATRLWDFEQELSKLPSVVISSKNTETQGDDRWLLHFGQNMAIPSAEPCDDAISRKVLISHIENQSREWGEDYDAQQILGDIEDMPSVKLQEPNTGWRIAHGMYEDRFWCSCGYIRIMDGRMNKWKFCPVCGGARMVEEQKNRGIINAEKEDN